MKQRKGGGQVQAGSVAEQNLCYNCFAQLQQTGGECPYCGSIRRTMQKNTR